MTIPTHLAPGADASSENATLRVSGLEVNYRSNIAIRDVSIAGLAPGSVNALLGPNGSGKSTLLKALVGLVSPQKGAVRLGRHDLTQASVAQRAGHVVYVPQSLPDAVHLRVIESVLVAANVGKTSNTSHHDAYAMLQRLGIAALALRYLDELSGGQKQLVGLAQALIRRPPCALAGRAAVGSGP
jgi:iron complex transport system ATP-binding protein